jgi:putative MATE family efflux protein
VSAARAIGPANAQTAGQTQRDRALEAGSAGAPKERGVLALAWPSLVENLLLQFMNMASLMMVGRLGSNALAGVGVANQVSMLLQVLFMGLSIGNTSLVARSVGARRDEDARSATRQSLLLGGGLGLALAAVCFPTAPWLLGLIGASPEVAGQGAVYLRAIMLTLPLMAVAMLANGALRGSGDTRTPMWATGAANVAHVAVAYPLIFGAGPIPALGLAGLGVGLVAGRTVACVLSLIVLGMRKRGPLAGTLAGTAAWKPDPGMIRRVLAVGGPAAAESGSVQAGMILFSLMTLAMGTEAFAAQQVVFNAASLSMMPGLAFSVAATTLVGQRIGAGDIPGAKRNGWRCTGMAAIYMSVAGLLFFLFPEPVVQLYTTDPAVIAAADWGIRIVGLGQPLQAAAFVLGGALRGAGDTRTTMLVGGASMWGVRLLVAYIFGIFLGWGVPGIWIGWCADWYARGLAFICAFWKGHWARLRV